MIIHVLNYSINSRECSYSEYEYFSSLEKLKEGKLILIEKDKEWNELSCSSITSKYLWINYTITVDRL